MKLVLAEKPSVAQSIAKVLGAAKREDGYLEGNGYVVSWCVGHLVELAQPEVYDAKYSKWAYADLPIFPMDWQYEVSAGTKKQFGILKKLMAREDVASLVCATDAGREGELIVRLVYHKAGCRKPFERLWISSMEDVAIKEGFENLRSGTEYDALYEAALCRERADCTFIDEYHTQIGYNVFHICQFAEIMERNGASYMPEPEIMGDEAAWKVGKDRILAVQTCEDGYDYTLLDENYNEIDGGQVDNPELSMLEVRRDILESFGLERRELRAMFYEDVMEQAFEVGRQAVVVNDPIAELAFKLDRFAENFDPYEYMDQVDDVQAHIQEIKADLAAGNTAPYREFLNTAIEEAREETAVEVAKVLKSQLDKLDSPKRESVMEKLAQAAEKAAPASPSPKRKEPER